MSERYQQALEWARGALPDEYPPFAASAALSLKTLGREVTPQMVRQRLVAQGRDAKSIAERAGKYGRGAA